MDAESIPLKLFIPGPTQVAPEVLAQMARPAIGHRTEECARLWASCRHGLAQLFQTRAEVLMLTGPASALMEAALRNTVRQRSLHLVCGAFSQRWFDIAVACGLEAHRLDAEWGHGFEPEVLRAALQEREYDAVTLVHNETSTGVMNPLPELAKVVSEFPDVLLLVDTVSSLAGAPVYFDTWGLDVCLAGVQKALALPAGLAVAAVSERTMQRASEIPHRGWFLDFLRLQKSNQKEQSPTTPSTAHLYALEFQLQRIFEEGLEPRWRRHAAMAAHTQLWAQEFGYELFAKEGFRSQTVTCIARGGGPDFVPALAHLKKEGFLMSNGYGPLKNKTFRIGHMGEHHMSDLTDLLHRFEVALAQSQTKS